MNREKKEFYIGLMLGPVGVMSWLLLEYAHQWSINKYLKFKLWQMDRKIASLNKKLWDRP